MKKLLLISSALILILVFSLSLYYAHVNLPQNSEPLNYTYSIVQTYPHDSQAFTEGLVYADGTLYESTGLTGASDLRSVDLETGSILKSVSLSNEYFGEGITLFGNNIIQLTWLSETGFTYNSVSFELLATFHYSGQGWGITNDGTKLIMSNGSEMLSFFDPTTYQFLGEVQVTDGETPIINLNELEYVNGYVYANVWHTDKIAIINPQTGKVRGWINLEGIYDVEIASPEDVLNGIAYDNQGDRLFVTGKRWSQLFEIRLELSG